MSINEKDSQGLRWGGVLFTPDGPESFEGDLKDFAKCFGEPDFIPAFHPIEVKKDGVPIETPEVAPQRPRCCTHAKPIQGRTE